MRDLEFTAKGAEVYFTKPCRRGHSGMRYVSNGECVECHQYNYQNIYKKTMRHLKNAMAEIDRLEKELL
jgi:hypothetical protein